MPSATEAKRYGHIAARTIAFIGGVLLGTTAAISYFIAGYADDALNAGTGAAEDALRDGSAGLDDATADEAADWFERASDWLVEGRPDQFRNYCLIAIGAAAIAMVAALVRRPDALWPELVWGVAAIAGLAPNLAFDFWFAVWTFTGSLIAGAAVIHYLARRDDHVRLAAAATKRAGAAAAPHVGSAFSKGSQAATDAYRRARGGAAEDGERPVAGAPVPAPLPAAPATAVAVPPAGWYSDPHGQATQRYWDGGAWTPHTPLSVSAAS